MFYAFNASSGLILLILLLITKLEIKPIRRDKTNIGTRQNGLNENEKPVESDAPISKLATIEMKTSSTEATIKEIKHWIKEW